MINIEKLFIIHFQPLIDRKKYLDNEILKLKLPFLHEYVFSSPENDISLIKDTTKYLYRPNVFDRQLTKGEICVSIKHFEVYEKILNENIQYALIIEDDAIFLDNFLDNLKNILYELPDIFDMCFISECCNLHPKNIIPGQSLYKKETSRCVSSYIVNRKNLNYVISSLPFQYPIDWHINMINKNGQLNLYWSEPCLFKQGSESVYKSNLR
jgi:glycosyl transferase family 25